MAQLIYSAIASADGYIEDAAGSFDWAAPEQDVLRFGDNLEVIREHTPLPYRNVCSVIP